MSTNYLALRSSAAVNLTLSTLTGSTITAPTLTVSTLRGSTMLGTTLAISTLTVSSINNNAPGTGTGSFSTLTVSSLVSVSSISSASTMYTSSLVTTGSVGVGTTPGYALDVISSSQYVYTSFGQTWTTISGPPSAVWNGVAISATGQYQTAVYGSYANAAGVYSSNNYGSTWTAVTIPTSQQYQTVAMSASGQYQVTGVNGNGGKIYVSTDYGVTWNVVSSSYTGLWNGFGMSSTGQYMVGVLYYYSSFIGTIYYSSDYGVTWTQATGLSSNSLLFTGVCCSGSGQYQTACANGSGLWYSSNYGASWTLSTSSGARVWVGACCSLSGQYQSACVLNGSIYYSSDYGVTWTSSGVANAAWQDICCDSTAQYQLCTVSTGKIWYSTNYGQSWTISNSATATWARPRMSRYGQYSIANVNNGTLYSSNLSAPTSLLTRIQSSNDTARIVLDGALGADIIYKVDGVSKWGIACNSNNLQFLLNDSTSTAPVTFTSGSNVGIGTITPVGQLSIVLDGTGVGNTYNWSSGYAVFGPGAGSASGSGVGITYNTANNYGALISLTPGIAWRNMFYYANSHYFYYGATPLMTILSSGNVGIGTSNPTSLLQVAGAINCTSFLVNGTAVATGTGSVWGVSGSTAYYTSGNVGISTTDPQNNKLRVFGGNANSGISLGDYMTSAGVKYIGMTAVSDGTNVSASSGFSGITWGPAFDGGTSGYLAFHTHGYGISSDERMRIDKAGLVGISTTVPITNLHVRVATYSTPIFIVDAGRQGVDSTSVPRGIGKPLIGVGANSWSNTASGDYYGIGFGYNANNTSGNYYPAEIGFLVQSTAGGEYGDMVFSTRPTTSGTTIASERMRITSSGTIGIGTSGPVGLLHVNSGTGTIPVLNAWNSQWSMFGGTGTTAQAVGIGFCAAASTFWNAGGQIIAVQPSTAMFPLNYYASVHNFYANTTATSPPSLVVIANGNVGVGTATPVGVLDVYGSFRVLSKPYVALTSGTGIEFVYDGGGNLTCGTRSSSVPTLTTANMNYAAASHNFYIGAQAATSAMLINTSGNVGIATATPGYALDVNGITRSAGVINTVPAHYIGYTSSRPTVYKYDGTNNTNGTFYADNYNYIAFPTNTQTPAGFITATGGKYTVAYNGIYAITFTTATSATNNAVLETFISKNGYNGATDLNAPGTITLCSSYHPASTTQWCFSWTGYLSTSDFFCVGFYTSATAGALSIRTTLSVALVNRSG